MLNIDKVMKASDVLNDIIRKTNIIKSRGIVDNCELYLKPENLQNTGSFKIRGSSYKITTLNNSEKKKGVICCSAGNHAQGVALAAHKLKIPAVICLPDTAPISKIEATKSYGAEVVLVPGCYDDAFNKALEIAKERNMTFIHPFDDEDVIIGQATIGLEIIDELRDVDAVVVPVGGGGLISGVAYAIKQLRPNVKIYGVQAEGAPSMYNSLKKGEIVALKEANTMADGISVKVPGKLTYDLVKKYVDKVVTVSEDEICSAILTLMEKQKMIAEGAGAVSLAAVMFDKLPIKGKKVCCVISGGNIDVSILNKVIEKGLAKSGRRVTLTVEVKDKPGYLSDITNIIGECGANIFRIHHERVYTRGVYDCSVVITLETRNYEHVEEIIKKLKAQNHRVIEVS